MNAVAEIGDPDLYRESYQTVWSNWAQMDPDYAIQNIQQIQPEFRTHVISTAVRSLIKDGKLQRALSAVLQLKSQGENVALATSVLSEEWARYDASQATDWLLATTTINDVFRVDVLNRVLPVLAKSDPLKAYEIAIEYGESEPIDRVFPYRLKYLKLLPGEGIS